VKKSGSVCSGSAAYPFRVLRQAQHEARVFLASPDKINIILSLSKDEAAASVAGKSPAMIDFFTASKAGIHSSTSRALPNGSWLSPGFRRDVGIRR
jgi:hypothetical protein